MGRLYAMTFNDKQARWFKKYQGKQYSISCKELRCEPTRTASYQAANAWWLAKKKELDEAAQSASLVRFLIGRTEPAKFLDFVEASGTLGYDAALNQHFGLHNVAELESVWLQSQSQTAGPVRVVSSRSRG